MWYEVMNNGVLTCIQISILQTQETVIYPIMHRPIVYTKDGPNRSTIFGRSSASFIKLRSESTAHSIAVDHSDKN